MTQQIINIGTSPDSGDGDTVRVAFDKTNQNFTELYGAVDDLTDEIIDKSVIQKDLIGSVYADDGSTVIVDSSNSNVNANNLDISGTIDGNLIPSADSTYTLGSPTHQWKSLTGQTIYIDGVRVDVNESGELLVNGVKILSLANWEDEIKQQILSIVNTTAVIEEIDGGSY